MKIVKKILSIRNTLIFLYALPLVVLTLAYFSSDHFKEDSLLGEIFVAMVDVYIANTRDILGGFMVPFLTANAFAESNDTRASSIEKSESTILFYTLVTIFLLSIFVYCVVKLKFLLLISNSNETDDLKIETIIQRTLEMAKSYIKETISFMALILGIKKSKSDQ